MTEACYVWHRSWGTGWLKDVEVLQVDMYQDKEEQDLGMDFSKYQALNLSMLPYLHQWHLEATQERWHVASIVREYYHH